MRMVVGTPGWQRAKIYLDGAERTHVIEADEERRFIIRYATDENGEWIKSADGGSLLRETLRGDVAIVIGEAQA